MHATPEGPAAAQRRQGMPARPWTTAPLRWLSTVKMAHAAQQIGFQEYLHSITESDARIERLEQAMREVANPT